MKKRFVRKTIPLIVGMILVYSGPVCAADIQEAAKPLSLGEAIRIALVSNPQITVFRSRVNAAKARVIQARSGFMPQLNFFERYDYTTNPMWAFGTKLNQGAITQPDFNPDLLNNPDPIQNFNTTFSLAWPVFDSGQTWFGKSQAELAHEAARLMLERTQREVIAQVMTAYAKLLLTKENLTVAEKTLETARFNLKMVKARFDSGFFVKSDLLRAQVRIIRLEQEHLQADSALKMAQAGLCASMGLPSGERFELITPLETDSGIDGNLEDWIGKALETRTDLKNLRQKEKIAQEEIKKARAAHWPELNLVGDYQINTESFSDSADNYTVGARLDLNLFSGQRLSSKTTEAQAMLEVASAAVKAHELGVRVETEQAYLRATSAWQCINVSQEAVHQAEEALRIVSNRYKNGLVTIVELLDVELTLQRARTNHFRRLFDHQVARTKLFLAAGTLSDNFE